MHIIIIINIIISVSGTVLYITAATSISICDEVDL